MGNQFLKGLQRPAIMPEGSSLPDYSEANDGDALIIEDGEPAWGAVDALPEIEETDEGKFLGVDQGEAVWADAPSGGGPVVTPSSGVTQETMSALQTAIQTSATSSWNTAYEHSNLTDGTVQASDWAAIKGIAANGIKNGGSGVIVLNGAGLMPIAFELTETNNDTGRAFVQFVIPTYSVSIPSLGEQLFRMTAGLTIRSAFDDNMERIYEGEIFWIVEHLHTFGQS